MMKYENIEIENTMCHNFALWEGWCGKRIIERVYYL